MPRQAYLTLDGQLATFDPDECEPLPDPVDRPSGTRFDLYRTPEGAWILHYRHTKPLRPFERPECQLGGPHFFEQIEHKGVAAGLLARGQELPESLVRDIEAAQKTGPTADEAHDHAPPPVVATPDFADLIARLRKGKKLRQALLVEYMADKDEATVNDVAEHVHDDVEASEGTVRANVRRTNDSLVGLMPPLLFRVAASRVYREFSSK